MKRRSLHIVDLTFPIHEGMRTFPTRNHPRVTVSTLGVIAKNGRATRKIVIGTHTGTHIDAPAHFIPQGATIDTLSLKTLTGDAVMLDLGFVKPRTAILKEHLSGLEEYSHPERLLIRTGWSKRWRSDNYYKDYPYLSGQACRYIVSKKIKLLGLDTPSPDNPCHCYASGNDSPNHKYFFRKGIILVEYLTNLNKIDAREFFIVAMPLPIRGGDGSPARVIAYWG